MSYERKFVAHFLFSSDLQAENEFLRFHHDLLGIWYKNDNFARPHSSLKYQIPVTFENLNKNLYFTLAPVIGG
jgi:hypothetical protein